MMRVPTVEYYRAVIRHSNPGWPSLLSRATPNVSTGLRLRHPLAGRFEVWCGRQATRDPERNRRRPAKRGNCPILAATILVEAVLFLHLPQNVRPEGGAT